MIPLSSKNLIFRDGRTYYFYIQRQAHLPPTLRGALKLEKPLVLMWGRAFKNRRSVGSQVE